MWRPLRKKGRRPTFKVTVEQNEETMASLKQGVAEPWCDLERPSVYIIRIMVLFMSIVTETPYVLLLSVL